MLIVEDFVTTQGQAWEPPYQAPKRPVVTGWLWADKMTEVMWAGKGRVRDLADCCVIPKRVGLHGKIKVMHAYACPNGWIKASFEVVGGLAVSEV